MGRVGNERKMKLTNALVLTSIEKEIAVLLRDEWETLNFYAAM